MESYEQFNEMYVKVDWLAFTVDRGVEYLIHFLGLNIFDFIKMPRGARGYKSMIKHKNYDCSILYDGSADMGVHVEITGSGFNGVFNSFLKKHSSECIFGVCYDTPLEMTHLSYFLSSVLKLAKNISRVDIAVDDYTEKYFSVDDVVSMLNEGRCVSRFRNYRPVSEKRICDGSNKGNTVYFGSRCSDVMLRVYDKALEQKYKDGSWVRWEVELKGHSATKALETVVQYNSLSKCVFGLLSNYIKFINLDKSNRSKCSVYEPWNSFINNAERVRLYTGIEERTIEDKREWFDKQVGPTYARIVDDDGGAFIFDNIDKWRYKGGVNFGV